MTWELGLNVSFKMLYATLLVPSNVMQCLGKGRHVKKHAGAGEERPSRLYANMQETKKAE